MAAATDPNAARISSTVAVGLFSSSSSIMIIHHWFARFLRHTAHENVAPARLLRHATPPHIGWVAAGDPTRGLRFPSAAGLHHDCEIERTVAVHARHAALRFITADSLRRLVQLWFLGHVGSHLPRGVERIEPSALT